MRRTISTSPYSTGPRILAPPPDSNKTTAFQNGSCLCIKGKLVPIPTSTHLPEVPQYTQPLQSQNDSPVILNSTQNVQSTTQYLYVLAVKKRNLYIENKVFIDIEKYDVYEVICFYNNERGATLAYTYYTPNNSDQWRVISKVLKRTPYNSNVDIDKCETLQEAIL